MSVKQVIVFRRDLKCRKGKLLAQSGHAAMMFLSEQLRSPEVDDNVRIFVKDKVQKIVLLTQEQQAWFDGLFTKICLVVDGEAQLRDLYDKAKEAGLTAHMVIDAGLTEFAGVPTLTCIAIGPHEASRLGPVTAGLDLY